MFEGCIGLTSITVDSVNANYSSNDGVLFNKDQTTLIQFPGGKGGSYTIPTSVTSIDSNAFAGCTNLTSIAIPSSVTSVEVFEGCTNLTSITVDTDNANYSSIDGVLFNKDKTTLFFFPRGKGGSYTIPTSVTSIDSNAFAGCTNLTSIAIPSSVTSIGGRAFKDSSLTTVTIANGQVISDITFTSPTLNVSFFGRTVETLSPPPVVVLQWVSLYDSNVTYRYTSDAEYSDVVLERYHYDASYLDILQHDSPSESDSFNLISGTRTETFGYTGQGIIGFRFRLFIQSRSFRSNMIYVPIN